MRHFSIFVSMKGGLLILVLLFTFSWIDAQTCKDFVLRSNTALNVDLICSSAMVEDLKELKGFLEEIHPDLYRFISQKSLDSAFYSAIELCKTDRTLFSFSEIINDFLSTIKDSHTLLNIRDLYRYKPASQFYYPFYLQAIQGKYYVVDSWQNIIPKGSEFINFNGTSPKAVLSSTLMFTPIEAQSYEAQQELSDHLIPAVLNLQHGLRQVKVSFINNQDTITKTIKRMKSSKALRKIDKRNEASKISYERHNRKAILTIPSFSPRPTTGFKNNLDEIFNQIQKDSIEDLAIDVRNNTGGYILLQEYLMSFIAPKNSRYTNQYIYKRSNFDRFEQLSRYQRWRFKKTAQRFYPNGAIAQEWDFFQSPMGTIDTVLNEPVLRNKHNIVFNGNCTLFVNSLSMSASANLAAWFSLSERGKIIGSRPSGTHSGTFANPCTVFLNNTALPIVISTMKVNATQTAHKDESLVPDLIIIPTREDLVKENDVLKSYFLSH